jgi:hypothetical protein
MRSEISPDPFGVCVEKVFVMVRQLLTPEYCV